MSDDEDRLRAAIDQLQAQLDAVRKRDPTVGAQLEVTMAEARAVLAGQSSEPTKPGSLVGRLQDAVLQYEASHPVLAGNLGSVIDALAQMGI